MRLPDPIANTTTEAYLAYKAGVLAEGDLKPKLYEPYIHLDAWLAYWAGLTKSYPVKNVGKNLFDKDSTTDGYRLGADGKPYADAPYTLSWYIPVKPNTTYTISFGSALSTPSYTNIASYGSDKTFIYRWTPEQVGSYTLTTQADAHYLRVATPLNRVDTTQCELGSTATTYEPYTGEPEMLTDEEAYIAYLSGVTDTYPEEFRDPADIRVAAYLRYLISARWGRPEYPVTNEELYLSMLKTKYIPSGDPSSDIEINGTAKAPFVDVKMYGDTFQQSYTGKNLLAFPNASFTSNGVTSVWENGKVTMSGTSGSKQVFVTGYCANNLAAGTYTFSLNRPSPRRFIFRTFDANDQTIASYNIEVRETSVQVTMTGNEAKYRIVMLAEGGSSYDEIDYFMLEAGTTATTWEKYVGGQASPSPEYPQPIQTVTGLQTVSVVGKNLFDIDQYTKAIHGAGETTVTKPNDNTLRVTNTQAGAYRYSMTPLPDTNAVLGKTITLKAGAKLVNSSGGGIRFYWASDQWYTTALGSWVTFTEDGEYTCTVTVPNNIPSGSTRLCVSLYGSATVSSPAGSYIDYSDIQVEVGSTDTAYEPYSFNDYEINLGKNLFDNTGWRQGQYNNGEWTDNLVTRATTPLIPIEPTTYTISLNSESLDTSFININYFDGSKNWLGNRSTLGLPAFGAVSREQTFTLPQGASYLAISLRPYGEEGANIQSLAQSSLLMLEKGSSKTSYAPYFTPIELCKLGTYQDYIYKDGEGWKVHKASAMQTIISENVGAWSSYTNIEYATYSKSEDYDGYNIWDGKDVLCDHATFARGQGLTWLDNASRVGNIIVNASVSNYWIGFVKGTPLETMKSKLNGAKILYPLATPTDTTITNQALIDQLDALVSGGAENGTTYIKVDATDPNLPGLLYVEAPKYE